MKLFVFTPAGTAQFFGSLGLPQALAYATIVVEVTGALALIFGVFTRWVALALAPIRIGAIVTVHGSAGIVLSDPNGGREFPAFWTIALVVQVLLGDGGFALQRRSSDLWQTAPSH